MRKDLTSKQNVWLNGQQVDDDDLALEQEYIDTVTSGTIYNHIGQGILPDNIKKKILFTSSDVLGNIDGTPLSVSDQPTDSELGNQLEVSLSDSDVFGLRSVKVAIFGLNFNSELIYETFVFHKNESQFSKLHYKYIITILVNDISASSYSLNLGGTLNIYEANAGVISRDCITVAQNMQPNLFWRDFFTIYSSSLTELLSAALPNYDVDSLNIYTEEYNKRELAKNDIVTEIGQKFKSNSNNIQKIRLLLSVENNEDGYSTDLAWEGDLVFTIYPLQSTISCPTDLAPNLEIEFDPQPIPLAQITLNYNSLLEKGYLLSNNPQPIDFIVSNTSIASSKIEKDKYYLFSLKRSGLANKCDILVSTGQDILDDSRMSIFNGNYWTDIQSEDLWFEIYSDSAKLTSAKLYENGFGIEINKVKDNNGTTEDYCLDGLSFKSNDVYTAIVTSNIEYSDLVENKRSGTTKKSKKIKAPNVELLSSVEISNLDSYSNSLKLGVISDKNKKFESSTTYSISLKSSAFIKNEIYIPLLEDNTDPRKDGYLASLLSGFLNGDLIGSKFTPDLSNPTIYYRVGNAEKLTMTYGDWNGDCIVDEDDLTELSKYLDYNLNISPPLNSNIITDTVNTTCTNGYTFLTAKSTNESGLTFEVIDSNGLIIDTNTDGLLVASTNTDSLFSSSAVDFTAISNLTDYSLVVYSSNNENNGQYAIVGINTGVLTIRKKYIDSDIILSLLRSNINGDFLIDGYDGYLIESYLTRNEISSFPTLTYPAPTTNPYAKIGSTFSVLKIQLESFVDRHDDYYESSRSSLHEIVDILVDNSNFRSNDFSTNYIDSFVNPKLQWNDYFIATRSKLVYVPNTIIESSGYVEYSCETDCVETLSFPETLNFDPGQVNQYIPDNIILGKQILDVNKNYFKIDFEVGVITLEIPDNFYGTEKTINIFDCFVYEYSSGKTIKGFKAMKFADCTYVQSTALTNNQVRFGVSLQSFSPNLDGEDGGVDGITINPKMGVYIDDTTGLLRVNFTDIVKDDTKKTLSTKIQINVFIKKAGFNNTPIIIAPELTDNLFI